MALSISANQILKQINIPLLLSLGLHGVFFAFILPKWTDNGNLSNNDHLQSTPVIELNQLEQTRVPRQSSVNTFNWNIINSLQQENNQTLPLNIPNIPLPKPPNNPLPTSQINNGGTINLPSLPPLPPPPASFDISSSKIPLLNNKTSPLSPPPNLQEGVNQKRITNLPSNLPGNNQQITTQIQISPEEAEIRQRIFANSPIEITANPRDVINRKNTDNNTNQNNVIKKETSVTPLPKNYQSLASKLEKKTENTSDEDARKNYVAWSTEVENVQSQEITLEGKYPKDACIRKLEGTTTYGIVVNKSGTVINTKLIKSSGYNLFNNQALKQIKNRQFANQTSKNQPYHVYVNFKYDSKICPSLSLNNLGKVPLKKTAPKSANQNNTNSQSASQPKSTTILPNSPKNTADVLTITAPSQPAKSGSPTPTIKPTSNDLKPLTAEESEKESVNPKLIESNSQPEINNSEEIKLVK